MKKKAKRATAASLPKPPPKLPPLFPGNEKDPRIFSRYRKPARDGDCLLLGLDIGTNCGYSLAWFTPGDGRRLADCKSLTCGQLDLSLGPFDSGAMRPVKLRQFLTVMHPDAIFYEDVKNVPVGGGAMNAAQLLARATPTIEVMAALKTIIATYAFDRDIPCQGVPIGHIKRRATGRGNANKVDIIEAAIAEFGIVLDPENYETLGHDNVADSLYCLATGVDEYGQGVTHHGEPAVYVPPAVEGLAS